jgi:trypsin
LTGAVLVSSRFVITAAHCRDADKDFSIGPSTFSGGIESLIANRTVHPLYDDFTYNNDIAIFELKDDITDIQYVKLGQDEINEPGQAMTVIGFGDTNPDEEDTDFTDSLQQADVLYVSSDICNRDHRGEIFDDMLCAEAPNKDACYGDSGGPLLLTPNDNSNDDRLVGIVSWGRGCADEEFPGVYTRISYFYDWIVETMCTMNVDGVPDYVDCNKILGIAENRDEDFSLIGTPAESPTPNPATPPPIETCGDRGATCTKVDDCCSERCNFGTGTCYPESTGGRDKISNGMGGSAGGSGARRNGFLGGGLGLQLP